MTYLDIITKYIKKALVIKIQGIIIPPSALTNQATREQQRHN